MIRQRSLSKVKRSNSQRPYRNHPRRPASHSNTRSQNNITIVASQAEAEAYASNTTANPPSTSTTDTSPNISMDKFTASFQSFGKQVSSTVSPFATRSQQWFREQTGNAGEKTELPHDYVELETRIDALKQTHQKLLAATSQYANEAYDYPPNVRESFQDLGKSIGDKVCTTPGGYTRHILSVQWYR